MSETTDKIKFLGIEGTKALLEGLKGEYSPLGHEHSDLIESINKITDGSTTVSKAEEAVHSSTADTATEATHATNADQAAHAESADEATHAETADVATKAEQDGSGNVITNTYETKTDATTKLEEAKAYADQIKSDIYGGAPKETLDTITELATAFEENQDVVEALNAAITEKQDKNVIVTVTSTTAEDGTVTYSADKTFEEIKSAINNEVNVFVKSNGVTYNLLKLTNSNIQFASYTPSTMLYKKFIIKNDNVVTYSATNIVATENIYGGIKADAATETDTVPARIGTDGKLYVPTYPEVIIDTEISAESENPVQNKVVKEYVDAHIPTQEETITLLTETGFISPATTASGDIYTNENGDIYLV